MAKSKKLSKKYWEEQNQERKALKALEALSALKQSNDRKNENGGALTTNGKENKVNKHVAGEPTTLSHSSLFAAMPVDSNGSKSGDDEDQKMSPGQKVSMSSL